MDADTVLADDYVERIVRPFADPAVVVAAGAVQTKMTAEPRLITGEPFAFIQIPRFGPTWRFTIVEGTSLAQLATGPGHVPGTQLPGQRGNFAVAAHDITAGNPFLHLRDLRPGDHVIVTTRFAVFRYQITGEHVVRYTDSAVLAAVPGHPGERPRHPMITLITCTPVTLAFTPYRIVVTGTEVSATPRQAAPSPLMKGLRAGLGRWPAIIIIPNDISRPATTR